MLSRTGAIVASELDLQKIVQAVTDADVQVSNAQLKHEIEEREHTARGLA